MAKANKKTPLAAPNYHWPILGHQSIKKYLAATLQKKTLTHAYLFYGQSHVGKYSVAIHFVASLFCKTNSGRPCWQCPTCKQILQQTHPDIYHISPEPDKKSISIEQIRKLQHSISLHSFLMNYKAIIIEEADNLTEEASNALLKTLEEPTEKTVIILIANFQESLPLTIRSRCQRIFFNILPTFQIENWLISRGVTASRARAIARYSNGKPGIAIQLASNLTPFEERKLHLDLLMHFFENKYINTLHYISDFIKNYTDNTNRATQDLLDSWIYLLRDALLIKISKQLTLNIPLHSILVTLSEKYSSNRLLKSINSIQASREYLDHFIKPQFVLEHLALTL
ncbi:MAG: DNA polymerase III subunit delta' [Patescibacteria group bacterium]|nr:DNA polymerase III subunit delta' [Patescibacteria group bacterium]